MEKQKKSFNDLLQKMLSVTTIFLLGMAAGYMIGFTGEVRNLALNYYQSEEYTGIETDYTIFLFEDNKRLNNQLLITLNESNNWKEAYNLCQKDNFRLYEELNN